MALFKIQARVIDLLGEQQIANCPTAISELFKNAYDACAEKVMLDVYPDDNYAILWDDGIGMSEKDISDRWLVVGTAYKSRLYNEASPVAGCGRPIQGEKGIGRLAISTLGDSLLLISKQQNQNSDMKHYVALFINWNIVRNDRLMLEDIEVPLISFSDIEELDDGLAGDMIEKFRQPLLKIQKSEVWAGQTNQDLFARIMKQLDDFRLFMPSIRRSGLHIREHGTLFYISDLKEDIPAYVRRPFRDQGDEEPNTELVQLLNNFQNRFELYETSGILPFEADVRRWDAEAKVLISIFQEWQAFEREDLFFYDQSIDVRFDEWGQYEGILEIYKTKYPIRSTGIRPKRPLNCGPFHLRLWYFQNERETSLDPEKFGSINKKLIDFGGLMIYRDGLRVMPYGLPAFDWLLFEQKRSKGAGRYFFSYRRMFGYIKISRDNNPNLKDKAGREGLLSNPAYRNFKNLLMQFFSDIALQYFHKSESFKEKKEAFRKIREQLKEQLIEQEQRYAEETRNKLRKKLSELLNFLKDTDIRIEKLIRQSTEKIGNFENAEVALDFFNDKISEMESKAKIRIPEDLSLGNDSELKRIVYDYEKAVSEFSGLCAEARKKYAHIIANDFDEIRRTVFRRNTIRKGFNTAVRRIENAGKEISDSADKQYTDLKKQILDFIQNQIQKIKNILLLKTSSQSIEDAFNSDNGELFDIINNLELSVSEVLTETETLQSKMNNAIESIFGKRRDILLAAQTEEIEKLRSEVDKNLELVQLGLSVEIIDHELNRLYRGIKTSLQRLSIMVRNAPNTRNLIGNLSVNFQHLEERYKLMAPLYRGTYRKKEEISGQRILDYINMFLQRYIESSGVRLISTKPFLNFRITEVPSVILPTFVNLTDNAIYWLKEQNNPTVIFNIKDSVVTVCDNGPGIHETQLEEIFTSFFTTKPDGRGLGLYVARANLSRYGHEIWATNDSEFRELPGACFCIRFRENVIIKGDKHE